MYIPPAAGAEHCMSALVRFWKRIPDERLPKYYGFWLA
jgi:hypothetical protein